MYKYGYNYVFWHSRQFCTYNFGGKKIKNFDAVRMLKNIKHSGNIVNECFEIYNNIYQKKNIKTITSIMKIINKYDPKKIVVIWDDIIKDDVKLDDTSALLIIKCCTIAIGKDGRRNIGKYSRILTYIMNNYSSDNISIKTGLINGFGLCFMPNEMNNVLNLFNSIPKDSVDTVLVNAMMKYYVNNNAFDKGINLYERFNHLANTITNSYAIKSYANMNNFDECVRITEKDNDISLKNLLIKHYGLNSDMENAVKIYEMIEDRNKYIETLTTMMNCYINSNASEKAIDIYEEFDGFHNDISRLLVIKAYMNLNEYQKCYDEIISKLNVSQTNIKEFDIQLLNTLINFYGEFNDINRAIKLFEEIPNHKKINSTYNSMMSSYIDHNMDSKAIELYDTFLNKHTEVSHIYAIKAYAKMNDIRSAQHIFDTISNHDKTIGVINVMLTAYFMNSNYHECMELFKKYFISTGNINPTNTVKPNIVTYEILFKTCEAATAYHFGKQMHQMLLNSIDSSDKDILNDTNIQMILIDMYGKCTEINECENIFNYIKANDTTKYKNEIKIWNSMINNYGRNGDITKAFEIYYELLSDTNITPNTYTYCNLLNSCSHCGATEKAINLWENEITNSDIKHDIQVYTSYIDCLGRKGLIKEAYNLVSNYNNSNNIMWMSLLGSCRKHKNIEYGLKVYNEIKSRYNTNPTIMASAITLLINIYGSNGYKQKVSELQAIKDANNWKPHGGQSTIYINGIMHTFYAGNGYRSNKLYKDIDSKLLDIETKLSEYGYNHDISNVTRNIRNDENEYDIINKHSEKIALCYGLLSTNNNDIIVINKNLRMCLDCHESIKILSLLENRTFIIADKNRSHKFHNGKCSCNDYY